MKFNEFLKHYLTPQDGSLIALSQFKHNNELDYAKYRDRAQRVESFYQRDASRSLSNGHVSQPLTAENFAKYEGMAESMDKICGKKRYDLGDNMQTAFSRLTNTEQQDIYYRAMLQGRVDDNGKANLTQSDFNWIHSADYQKILDMRKAEGITR